MSRRALLFIGFAALPIAASLLITAGLVAIVGSDPVRVFETTIQGAFRDGRSVASIFNFWVPLMLCCVGLIVTFTSGLWNIGVEGQMLMGAVFASWGALFLELPAPFQIGVELLLAMIGGMLWAALVGLLKTRLKVHEIFGGVALNSLASVLTIYLLSGPWLLPGGTAQSTPLFRQDAVLPSLSPEFPISLLSMILVFAAMFLVTYALRGTRWGLHLRARGKNPHSALLIGVPTTQVALTALLVCGALAGLAGGFRALFTYTSLRPLLSGGIGFLALLVVLLVGRRVLWAALVGLVFGVILVGSTRLKIALQLDTSLAGVLQGLIVLMVLLANGIRARMRHDKEESPA